MGSAEPDTAISPEFTCPHPSWLELGTVPVPQTSLPPLGRQAQLLQADNSECSVDSYLAGLKCVLQTPTALSRLILFIVV